MRSLVAPALAVALLFQQSVGPAGPTSEVSVGDTILYDDAALALTTAGTSEEVLKTVTIPAGVFSAKYTGFTVCATAAAAANTNQKTIRIRVGGIGGTIVAAVTNDATSANTFQWCVWMRKGSSTSLGPGQGTFSRATGSTSLFTSAAVPGLTFASTLDVTVTGLTASAAGDVTLTSLRVVLHRRTT